MASIFPKKRSPFWYLQFLDKEGKARSKSTGLRRDIPLQTVQARELAAKYTRAEIHRGEASKGNGWDFVPKFLVDHCTTAATLNRYRNRWDWLSLYLADKQIRHPLSVKFTDGQGYVDWRTGYLKRTGKQVCRNTAIMETKLFSLLMNRAARLGLCETNPLTRLGMRKDNPAEKPEITDGEFRVLLPALEKEPEWMRLAFLIAMHTGCRQSETVIPMDCIDFRRDTMTFPHPKGGRKRAFSIPIPPALRPVLEKIRDGRKQTLTMPFQPARQFQHFFRRAGMSHLTFHCLRVTFVTRLARAGEPLSSAMRRVNHASTLIHAVYQRLTVEDLRARPLNLFGEIGDGSSGQTRGEKGADASMETLAHPPMPAPRHK